jgi:hypothetical protein
MSSHPAKFAYSTALFQSTPLLGKNVFLHGKIEFIKKRTEEIILTGEDEKGTWEAYTGNIPQNLAEKFETGKNVRAYGSIISQPDGKNLLHAKWIVLVEKKEFEFAKEETKKEWEKLVREFPSLIELKPFIPKPAEKKIQERPNPKRKEEDGDFVPANEFQVEREFV